MPPRAPRAAASARPRVYLLYGQEDLRKRQALRELIEELVPPEDRELDVEYLDASGANFTGEALMSALRDPAMFSERRVVVVSNAGRLRGPRHQRTLDLLTQGIPTLPDFSTLILVAWAEEAGERRGKNPFPEKLMAAIRAAGKAVQFAPLKPEELARLAVTEAEAAGKKMVLAAAAMLAERAGPESYPVVQEARKLAAYVGDRPTITAQDVAVMVAPRPDDNVFHLLDATMSGDRRQALSLLGQLRESGMAVQQIIPMLARTLRQVAQAKYLSDQRIASTADGDQVPPEVRARLPQDGSLYAGGSPWLRKRLWEQARRISWSHLHQALDRLAVTDAGTKGWERGVEDPDLALELFVASLCETMQPAGASRSPGR